MEPTFVIYIAVALFAYALVSKRLGTTPISAPMVFVGLGVAGYASGVLDPVQVEGSGVRDVLELTLALLLFTDAAKVHVRSWEADMDLPTRLLTIGMPLTIVLGTIGATLVFPAIGLVAAALIATILAPTDAALGKAVVTNPSVPYRIREALGIESGLNDGIALPIILFLVALGESEEGRSLWELFLEGIGFGVLVGLGLGAGAALALRYAIRRSWIAPVWVRITVVGVAFLTFLVADEMGGSGFIAAYVGGNVFGRLVDPLDHSSGAFGEDLGMVLTMVSFLIFGAFILGPNQAAFTALTVIYAVLSLTVIRMVPVAIAMIGREFRPPTVLYLGWFGPRGLASIIFAGLLVEEAGLAGSEVIVSAVIVTVTLSVVLHGATAPWGANRYAAWAAAQETIADGASEASSATDD
ncbi:MAG: cation:proton antiporter [Acidimicrobiia bacterium]